eukprot:5568315-Lingulodinium_polyedra.AAC.1
MPESFRYQKLARARLHGCLPWQSRSRGAAGKNPTGQYLIVSTGMRSEEALSLSIDEGNCARHNK